MAMAVAAKDQSDAALGSHQGLQDGYDPRDMDIKLEPEFYTCAFVSPLQLGAGGRAHSERLCGECFFTLAMLIVGAMQCITVFGMSAYLVEQDKGYTDEFQLSTLLFAEGASTMPLGRAQDLCGTFDHIALEHASGSHSLRTPDGTSYTGTPSMPIFHTYKMPSGSWVFNSQGGHDSYVDKLLRVLHAVQWSFGALSENMLNSTVDYGILLVVMVAILWFYVLFELRKITKFVFVLHHLKGKGLIEGRAGTTSFNKVDGILAIERLNMNAFVVGCICVTMRFAVVCMMVVWGTGLLAASWNKLSLVLNALAIGIVFEIDVIIAYAVVDQNTISRVEKLKPITIRMPKWTLTEARKPMNHYDIIFSLVSILAVVMGAMLVRYHQVHTNAHALHTAGALCLFSGPTPQGRQDVVAPVPGFCESLLSVTCGPSVEGAGSYHGPCLVTDQNIFQERSVMLHADSELFENMYDKNGQRRSMSEWGRPQKRLTSSKTWISDEYLNLFRRVCVQLYQPAGAVDMRIVDPSIGMTTYSAPFYCSREKLFQAVFGKAVHNFDDWSTTFDLREANIVAALDRCRMTADNSAAVQVPAGSPSPAVKPAVPKPIRIDASRDHQPKSDDHPLPPATSAVASPGKFLRVKRQRTHQEVDQWPGTPLTPWHRHNVTSLHAKRHRHRHRHHQEVSLEPMSGGS